MVTGAKKHLRNLLRTLQSYQGCVAVTVRPERCGENVRRCVVNVVARLAGPGHYPPPGTSSRSSRTAVEGNRRAGVAQRGANIASSWSRSPCRLSCPII